ncbi:ribbon-helix-helix domain-containing protein [Thermodesulfobacteriota bacterium]
MARKNITTSIETDLIKKIKYLAVDMSKPLNELFEEAIKDLLKKYEKKSKK